MPASSSDTPAAYPIIVACIGEGREPSRDELRRFIRRLREEAYPLDRIDAELRRRISLLALAALSAG